jgi:hypothetical protein
MEELLNDSQAYELTKTPESPELCKVTSVTEDGHIRYICDASFGHGYLLV